MYSLTLRSHWVVASMQDFEQDPVLNNIKKEESDDEDKGGWERVVVKEEKDALVGVICNALAY